MIKIPLRPSMPTDPERYAKALSQYLVDVRVGLEQSCLTTIEPWDPPSVDPGASTSLLVTVRGAYLGPPPMLAGAAFSQPLPTGAFLVAQVVDTDTVEVVLINLSGGAVDLDAGDLRVDVWTT